jgi:hypothetical protein
MTEVQIHEAAGLAASASALGLRLTRHTGEEGVETAAALGSVGGEERKRKPKNLIIGVIFSSPQTSRPHSASC